MAIQFTQQNKTIVEFHCDDHNGGEQFEITPEMIEAPEALPSKRGPKPSGKAKKLVTLRLDPDVIDAFKSDGDGWQTRLNAVLREHFGFTIT